MLKAGPPDVVGRPEDPAVPEVCSRRKRHWGKVWGEGTTAEQQLFPPPSPHDCLSVSSASLPPYTLSHFSPMSLSQQGGGDIKRERERGKEKEKKAKTNSEMEERSH